LIDLIKQEIAYANKNMTEYMKKSVIQAINPNYKGGNARLAESIREKLNIDENGKVSIRKDVEAKNNMAINKLEEQFMKNKIDDNIARLVIKQIVANGRIDDYELEMNIKHPNRKQLIEKIKQIIKPYQYKIISQDHKQQVIHECDKMNIIKNQFEDALFECTNEYGDLKTQVDILERQLLDAQAQVAKYCEFNIVDQKGNNISQKHMNNYLEIKEKYKNAKSKIDPKLFFDINEPTSKALQKFRARRIAQNQSYQESIQQIRAKILGEKYVPPVFREKARDYANQYDNAQFPSSEHEKKNRYQSKLDELFQEPEKKVNKRAKKAQQ
jgi:hypothetical protein